MSRDHRSLPEPDPDLKPLPPEMMDALKRRMKTYDRNRNLKAAAGRMIFWLGLLGAAIYACVWTHRLLQPPQEQIVAPPVPAPRNLPRKTAPPPPTATYANDPIRPVPKK